MALRIDRARLFDKRVVQRNIHAGRVTKDEYRAWLKDLPDSTDKIMARDEGGDDDGYEPSARPVVVAAAPAAAPAEAAPAPAPAVVDAAPSEPPSPDQAG
ncbi:hypothetical protein [Paraliomyxa miuraensis]|uniref:hypothetical protein n=1 Tax=Paraliomyxa miuraensis TaxID=376150 RepID=UPI00224F5F9D|nr:hypothetical protein [Paraliomyxa miuraensis]MCX4246055.1 hypothetical protein [Paraliomyxa miuraensis]